MALMPELRHPLSTEEVLDLHKTLSNWGRWGDRDQLGTLNLITPEKRIQSAGLVRTGRSVSCARSLPTEAAPDNPQPVVHHMIATASEGWGGATTLRSRRTATRPPTSMRSVTSSTTASSTTAIRSSG